ncbi:alkene reductase [Chryseobacterium gleum]|uniref:alkene reductase n=1 Tax=Chryseobacterium gleum TaxID=250 RepID=UPI0028ACBAFF|nr:alkene reductase [Chryseobacterium gleum]
MTLFDQYQLGEHTLLNHVVMSPMTRARNQNHIPNELNAKYYSQRAGKNGAGLIITEGISISPTARGVLYVPGLYTREQVEGWKLVTKAVHDKGSVIYSQLWHVGRVAHTTNHPDGKSPISSSNVVAESTFAYAYNEEGVATFMPASEPTALTLEDIEEIITAYVDAAKNAVEAGFDGIEIHAGNGYLIEQFLNPNVNIRTDEFGGSIENRSRFLITLIERISNAIGSHKVGVRLSPYSRLNDMRHYEEIEEAYLYLAKEIESRNVSYIHFMSHLNNEGQNPWPDDFLTKFRGVYTGTLILAGGMTEQIAKDLLNENTVDLVAFGQPFIANPDLTQRFENNWPLNTPDRVTYYGGGEEGYTDYPYYQK